MERIALTELAFELISYSLLIGTAVFTVWYPQHLRRAKQQSDRLDQAQS
jgi:ABC-type nickel/cobalt efflux system permease component RcnA